MVARLAQTLMLRPKPRLRRGECGREVAERAFMVARGWGCSSCWSIPEQTWVTRATIKVPTPHHSTPAPTEGKA